MKHFDVVIIGSGPAGSSAAYFLRDSGLSIAIVERLSDDGFVRYHNVCAAGISAKAAKMLPLDDEYILNRFDRMTVRFPGNHVVRMKKSGYIIDRPRFFSHLAEISGAQRINASVVDIKEGYELQLSNGEKISCNHLVGADGAFSIVRKKIFGSKPKCSFPAVEYIVEGEGSGELEFELDERLHAGYIWRFPRGNNTCTGSGVGMYEEKEFITKGARHIPFGGVGSLVKGNAYLLGDAAAMANPVSFGGLAAAIRAAKKSVECIRTGKPMNYQKWWDSSRMSNKRFMDFHERVSKMNNDELEFMGRQFCDGNVYLKGAIACARRPKNTHLYFACFFAFIDGW